MYTNVDLYAKVRRAVMVENLSERATAKMFGINRKTVSKMLGHTVPPGYRRKNRPVAPKLGSFVGIIGQILQDDRTVLKKQRHTAIRIFERLRDEHGYAGGYTVVREYVAKDRLHQQEVFIPLVHPPGHAQVDFGEADIYQGGASRLGSTTFAWTCRIRMTSSSRHIQRRPRPHSWMVTCLVTHKSTPKLNTRHRTLAAMLAEHAGENTPFHIGVRVNKTKGLNQEYTQRSRSFLFVSIGSTIAKMLGTRACGFTKTVSSA